MNDVTTFYNGNQYIHKSLLAGTNLHLLRSVSDYQCRLMNENNHSTAKIYAVMLNATILTLMKLDTRTECIASEKENSSKNPEYEGGVNFHSAMRSFWFGHYDRCIYHCERGITLSDVKQMKGIMMMFYSGVSSFHVSRNIAEGCTNLYQAFFILTFAQIVLFYYYCISQAERSKATETYRR